MQKTDGDGPDAAVAQMPGDPRHAVFIEWHDRPPIGGHALDDAEASVAWNQWIGVLDTQVIKVVAAFGADSQHVLEAVRGQEGGPDALALQYGVRDHRGGAQDLQAFLRRSHIRTDQKFADTLNDGIGGIGRRAEHLVEMEHAGIVNECEIRECAACVERQPCHALPRSLLVNSIGYWCRRSGRS